MKSDLFMVFDVESVGLHGESYAVGWLVVDRCGKELESCRIACPSENAAGDIEGRAWIVANIAPIEPTFLTPDAVRRSFWAGWQRWRNEGAILVADCGWPVESRFLAACIDDDPEKNRWTGPYPLHDIASIRLAAGLDPLATCDRLPGELPVHDPLADARQSARLLIEALDSIDSLVKFGDPYIRPEFHMEVD